jgi:hypothetical protein
LEKLRCIVENKNPRPFGFRVPQFLSYFSPHAEAPSPEPIKARDPPKRAALAPLNLAVIPPYNPAQAPSLHARVSEPSPRYQQRSPSHRFPLFSTSGSSPRSLQISSEVSTSSPRQEPFFPSKRGADRREPDSWESISLGASEVRKSLSSREDSPRQPYVRRAVRETSPAYPRRDSRFSIRDRETLSAHEKSPQQIRQASKTTPREPKPVYRPSSERRPEPRSPAPVEEKRKRYSMQPFIEYKDEKTYRR